MTYFDTSYIVKCYLNEVGSTQVRALAESVDGLSSCLHARAEFWTAVKRNVREKLITADEATATFDRFEADESAGVWHWFSVERSLVDLACQRVAGAAATVFLRAADALHLACAEENGFTEMYTHDRHVLAATVLFGLAGKDSHPDWWTQVNVRRGLGESFSQKSGSMTAGRSPETNPSKLSIISAALIELNQVLKLCLQQGNRIGNSDSYLARRRRIARAFPHTASEDAGHDDGRNFISSKGRNSAFRPIRTLDRNL